ncbi:DUF1822 family protein [Oculatella sp. LEGE 06141]|uniref:DUF1822 family protein n=1 Tax=Oculatella sp. LEGE 06141 TaxID=1828648 RepID=UPI00187E2A1E|nr:DUF1822 family protein [Oculatella sp. LEGE 06141]MBE9178153.1 DUF1822 family protein [Oculatella sp. LEGE 06141]
MTLMFDTSIRLEIPDFVFTEAWQQQQSIQGDRWQTYLNQICFETIQQWLTEKFGGSVRRVEPLGSSSAWEIVNGSVLAVAETRLVLISTDAIDRLEVRVPQEWIDIPNWVGDYYLAIEVDTDDQWIEAWGYTTHERLKTVGEYDSDDRSYCLSSSELITDLNVLWTMLELTSEPTRAAVPELPPLIETQAENLINRLSQAEIPRLEIPFTLWGALLANMQWRQQLGRSRQSSSQSTSAHLSRWLQNQFEAGWLAIENSLNSPALAFSLRQAETTAAVQRVKQIVLSAEVTILMLIWLESGAGDRVAVRVRVLPVVEPLLPANLTLSLLTETGEVLQSVQARQQDNSIQLRRFRCPVGTSFRLQVELEDARASVSEDFVV